MKIKEGDFMKISFFKRSISLILILTFFCGSVFPVPFASASDGATESKPSIIVGIINKLKPSDNLSVKERASVMADKIKGGEPILPNKNAPLNISELSPVRASMLAGGSALKSSFSVKKIGFSAASTVGMKIFEQVKNGEKIDIGKAAAHLATAKYAGSFIGSGIGSAAGNIAGTFLAASVPGVGPVLGAFMPALFSMTGGALAGQMGSDIDKGILPSFKRAWAAVDKVELAARAAGTTIGSVIGSLLLPGIGTAIGSFLGGMIAGKLTGLVRSKINSGVAPVKKNIADNIRYGVEPEGVIISVIPEADASLYLKYDAVDMRLGERAKKLKDNIIAAYSKYVQLISAGFGAGSSECMAVFNEYKRAVSEYSLFRNANTTEETSR